MILNKMYCDMTDSTRFLMPVSCDGRTVVARVFWSKRGGFLFGGNVALFQRLFPDQTEKPQPIHYRIGFVSKDILDKERAENARILAEKKERENRFRNRKQTTDN
jgi:hypothetical protein